MVGPDSGLRRAITADRVPSMIFFGPPGSGKTTLARIVAHSTRADFVELSAVQTGVADVRRVLAEANERLGASGQRTILFLDEIHRFNKGQQDALLPAVESGLVTLIGATTENPYFEVNSALLSRCQLFQLDADRPRRTGPDRRARSRRAGCVAGRRRAGARSSRRPAATAETRSTSSRRPPPTPPAAWSSADDVADAARKAPLLYDKGGDRHYDTISAFIKSMRGSDADAAVYYLAVMIAGGEDPKFIARRMIVFASEDVGNADPQALEVAVAAARAVEFVGLPECRINLSQCAAYLARAPKSNAAYWRSRQRSPTCASAARCGPRRTCATPATRARRLWATASATATRPRPRRGSRPAVPARRADGPPLRTVNNGAWHRYSQGCVCRRRSRQARRPGWRWRCARPAPGLPPPSPAT